MKTIFDASKIAFLSIYAMNSDDRLFYSTLCSIISEMNEFKIMLGGDFIAVKTNKTDSNPASTRALKNLISQYALLDTWCTHHPHKMGTNLFPLKLYT